MDPTALIDHLWADYVAITPQATQIHALLGQRGEQFGNDHVALRTFAGTKLGLDRLAEPFVRRGWFSTGEYDFQVKKLRARSFSHADPKLPRVFISELRVEQLNDATKTIVDRLIKALPERDGLAMLTDSASWPVVAWDDYRFLLEHSEYAAWLAAFGVRVNHFTVAFDDLETFEDLEALNAFLRASGFELNGEGRQIQGSPAELLEQSSTVAAPIAWTFAGGEVHQIRSCYYEFARRYPDPSTGHPFDGFVTTSADKIFESTDARR